MTLVARWTLHCNGIKVYDGDQFRCTSFVLGAEEATTREVWAHARRKGWTRNLKTGQDFCSEAHIEVEGGGPTP